MSLTGWRLVCLVCLIAAQSPGFCAAQNKTGTARISGRVVSSESGLPIEHAEVLLNPTLIAGAMPFRTAFTDKDGRYQIDSIPAQSYSVDATAGGFVEQIFGRASGATDGPVGVVSVADGAILSSIDFRLDPAGSLHGTVFEVTGQPIGEGVSVSAVQPDTRVHAGKTYQPTITAKTDAGGHFLLNGLAPGAYKICVNGPDGYDFRPSEEGVFYRETWLGDATNYEQAVDVRAGGTGPDLRIVAPRIKVYTLTVVPVWAALAGSPLAAAPYRFEAHLAGRSHTGRMQPDGSETIPDLPSGSYKVAVTEWQGVQIAGIGEAQAEITDADSRLLIKIGGVGEIAGTVELQDAGLDTSRLSLYVVSSQGYSSGGNVASDGSFRIPRVPPGQYSMKVFLDHKSTIPLIGIRCGTEPAGDIILAPEQRLEGCIVRVRPD